MAIEAIQIVNRDYRRDVDLVLIGPDDDGIPVTDAHTFYYGPQPRQVVLGALSRSICVVNLSDSESFGIVLLEAWCSGKPVIAQRRCLAFSELVRPGTNGVLAESAAEVADAVVSYLDQPALAQAHADQGREMARAYTWSSIAGQIEDVMLGAIPATVHPDT
jgi:glycosyltransferase involved in cell wall biosynthesis